MRIDTGWSIRPLGSGTALVPCLEALNHSRGRLEQKRDFAWMRKYPASHECDVPAAPAPRRTLLHATISMRSSDNLCAYQFEAYKSFIGRVIVPAQGEICDNGMALLNR